MKNGAKAVTCYVLIGVILVALSMALLVNEQALSLLLLDGDITPPTSWIWTNAEKGENGWFISDVLIALYASDSTPDPNDKESGVWCIMYRLDGNEWNEYKSAMLIWQEGHHYLEYYSIDLDNNREEIHNYSFKIDKRQPDVRVIYPNGGEEVNGIVIIEWEAEDTCDPNLLIEIRYNYENETIYNNTVWHPISNGEENDGEYEWHIATFPEGHYCIQISASDEAGHIAQDTSNSSFVIEHPPPTVKITKPIENHLYWHDKEVMQLSNTTIIIGEITVEVDVCSEVGIRKVDFIVGTYSHTDNVEPYKWAFDEKISGKHMLKVTCYDKSGKKARQSLKILIFNL